MKTQLDALLTAVGNCQRKVRYRSPIDADLDIAKLWAEKHRNLVKYECSWCYQWHLTHGKWKDTKWVIAKKS